MQNVIFANGTSSLSVGTKDSASPLFADCPLSEVYIGRDITYPRDPSSFGITQYYSPFAGSNLQTIQFGENVTTLYYYLFRDCNNLQSITFPPSITKVNYGVFLGCSSISKLYIEDGTKSLYFSTNDMNPLVPGVIFMNDCPLEDIYIGRNITAIVR